MMPMGFEAGLAEMEMYKEDLLRMYKIEELMLKSDFGRADPKRVHELARRAVGIPDHVELGRTPLGEWLDDSVAEF
jgi:hypothetical protein